MKCPKFSETPMLGLGLHDLSLLKIQLSRTSELPKPAPGSLDRILGGSWVGISGVISRVAIFITLFLHP